MNPYRIMAFAWLVLLTILHLWMIGSGRWPLSADEAHYWEWSRRLDWSYYSKGPMVAYLIALSTWVGRSTEFWVRLPAVLLATATALVGYSLARRTFRSERAGFVTLVLLSVMPLYAIGAVLMTIDPPFVFCWGLAWLFLSHVRARDGGLAWYGAGAAFGVGLLSKYTMFMLVPCVLLWLAASPRLSYWFRRREPYEGLALGLLIFSPVIVWNVRHDWYSLRHVVTQAGGGGEWSLLATLRGGPEFLASQLGVVSPLVFLLLLLSVRWAWREGFRRQRDDLLLLVFASAPVFLFFQVWSFFTKVQANWAAPAYLTAVATASGWYESWFRAGVSRRSRERVTRLLLVAILLPALLLPVAFAPESLERTGLRVPIAWDLVGKRLKGWPELGRAVGETAAALPRSTFLASDRYQIASQLAFYVPGQPRVYSPNFGRRMNQYDLWGGWEDLVGRDGLFVMAGDVQPPEDLRAAFRTVERVRTVSVFRDGRPLHTFSIFHGQEFRGFPNRPFSGF